MVKLSKKEFQLKASTERETHEAWSDNVTQVE